MRIDSAVPVPENVQTQNVASRGSSAQPNPSTSIDSNDQTQLSASNATVQQLKSTVSQLPEIRPDRVEALRQAVASGSYQVSDQQLANAMASDLLGNVVG